MPMLLTVMYREGSHHMSARLPNAARRSRAPGRTVRAAKNGVAVVDDEPCFELPPEDLPLEKDLVTEDKTPVDNEYSERQQRLLTEPLYSSWKRPGKGRTYTVNANVGMFYNIRRPPLVPEVFLSVDVLQNYSLH